MDPRAPSLTRSLLLSPGQRSGRSMHGQGPPDRGRALAPKAAALASTWGPQMSPECPASPRAHRERCRAQRGGNWQIRVRSISISDIRQSHKNEQLTGWKTTFLCARCNREAVTKRCLTIWGTESRRKQRCHRPRPRSGRASPRLPHPNTLTPSAAAAAGGQTEAPEVGTLTQAACWASPALTFLSGFLLKQPRSLPGSEA